MSRLAAVVASAALVLSSIFAAAPAAATEDAPVVPVEEILVEGSGDAVEPAADEPAGQAEGEAESDDAAAEESAAGEVGESESTEEAGEPESTEEIGEPESTEPVAEDEAAADGDATETPEVGSSAPSFHRLLAPMSVGSTAGSVVAGNVLGGSASWGMSTYLSSANFGRPNPLPSAYSAPASFDETTRIATWGEAYGEVATDGSASIAVGGTSVNFAKTGGGWLRIADLEIELDAAGNGSVTAAVSYGTSTLGTPPAMSFDPAQAADRGPERLTIVTLSGNSVPASIVDDEATWTDLAGTWHDDFLAFLAGDGGEIEAWTYASTLNNTAGDRLPSLLSIAVDLQPVPVYDARTYNTGGTSWGMSTYLSSTNFGRPNPLPSAYSAPASFDETTRIATWGGGSGSVATDGTATLAFEGTSVNFAKTGGGWLRITDVGASLDANGNGAVTAVVSYGTSTLGTPPAMSYDPSQAADRGPERLTIVTLAGNATPVVQDADTATWTDLAGTWHADFLAFLAGDGGTIAAWSYASTLNNSASDRLPSTFDFQLGVRPPAVSTTTALSLSPGTSVATGTAVTATATVAPSTAVGTVEFRSGATVLGTATVSGGTGSATLSSFSQGTHTITAHFSPADATAFAASQSAASTLEVLAPPPVVAGSLNWGIKSSFGAYITGPIAHGTITTSGVGTSGGVYQFGQSGASGLDGSGIGSVSYSGSVHYYGHAGALDITFSNPSVTVHSSTSATLYVTVNGSSTALATLALDSGVRTANGWAGVPATLTAAGAAAFDGRYAAGEGLDPVTFVAGAASGPLGGTTTVASAPTRTAAATPPATEGIQMVGSGTPKEGDPVTITATGFEPNEQRVLVVIYSTPQVLGTANADATGTVTWTGKLPKGLTGKHTLTLQGSVDRGLVVDIASAAPRAVTGCVAESVELSWGFKEAWRSYVSGTIAHGDWEVAGGATYETPLFGWTGTGSVDPQTLKGAFEFAGSVRFTGHDGVLDTTVLDPRIELDGDRATLLLDVEGENRSGEAITESGVAFADLDLEAAQVTLEDGVLTIADIPAVLTAAGATVISYPVGEALDPVTIVVELGAACAVDAPAPVATADGEEAEIAPISSGPDLTWLWWVLGALALAIIVAVVVVVLRRRGAAG